MANCGWCDRFRQSVEDLPGHIRAGTRVLPHDWLAGDAMRQAMRAAACGTNLLATGNSLISHAPMRALLCRHMADQGVECNPDQILLTESGTHTLEHRDQRDAVWPYRVAPRADLRIVTKYVGNPLGAELLTTILTDGSYRHHMDLVRGRLAPVMARVVQRITALGIEPWTIPECGMSLWVRLPGGRDYLRLNITQVEDVRFYAFMARALGS
jgi:DNA-binding transcriptional MocR family regulator